MNRRACILSLLLGIFCLLPGLRAGASDIVNTKHNLSKTGPGEIRAADGADDQNRICVFCHAPHNASALTPLWNKNIEGITYSAYPMYESSTMFAPKVVTGPAGPSRLCLSCHDGTIALGDVLRPTSRITLQNVPGSGRMPSGRSNFGASLASHHPISFSYYDAASNPEINPDPPLDTLLFYGNAMIECTTCHDAHDNANKKFLSVSNRNSYLCMLCHTVAGWTIASHRTSVKGWNHLLDDPWPRTGATGIWDLGWTTVEENGCENCHAPHSAGGVHRLLNSDAEEQNCYPCHNGNVAQKNIKTQFDHMSRHDVAAYTGVHDPKETLPVMNEHVECVDCHNPHISNSVTAPSEPGGVSGITANVTGVDKDGHSATATQFARFEYEICFKCHAQSSTLSPVVDRVLSTTRANLEFSTTNASYHPVIGPGKRVNPLDVPSILSVSDPEVPPGLSTSSVIYCTDCHSDEVVTGNTLMSRGPHGSPYAPILRRQYLTTDIGIAYSDANFGLCYRCHDKISILANSSFRANSSGYGGHRGHLTSTGSPPTQVNAPCSVCHDPHGVEIDGGTGSHTYLINFDTMIVTRYGANPVPFYTDKGGHSGSCTLVCHGVSHDGSDKYSYGSGAIQIRW